MSVLRGKPGLWSASRHLPFRSSTVAQRCFLFEESLATLNRGVISHPHVGELPVVRVLPVRTHRAASTGPAKCRGYQGRRRTEQKDACAWRPLPRKEGESWVYWFRNHIVSCWWWGSGGSFQEAAVKSRLRGRQVPRQALPAGSRAVHSSA